MVSYPPHSRLTRLQRELIEGFFALEQRFYLTGGAALSGFYLGHRLTDDLDLFAPPGPDLDDAARAVESAASACGVTVATLRSFPAFRRLLTSRGDEQCVVDLVIDRVPAVEPQKTCIGPIRIDTLREIAANKVCTLVSRSEIKDLVDIAELLRNGVSLELALGDAVTKDAGADPASIAWVLDQMSIGPEAPLPGEVDPAALESIRQELVRRLRVIALQRARESR